MEFNTVSVLGLGYIGLPTAAILASRGVNVIGVDVNQQAVNTINNGEVHIVEPDLDIVVRAAVATGKLRATTEPEAADAYMVAVPTPFKGSSKEPDLSYIRQAAEAIAPLLSKGALVVLESTSPVGATEQLCTWLQQWRPDLSFPHLAGDDADIKIAHCPERVLPGHVLQELVSNDRVIGGISPACSAAAMQLYQLFVKGECVITNARTAEMAKLTENAFRDVNIAFANELSVLCEQLRINVWELIRLANRHPRVNILSPGPGVGGHCIAVDPWFIVHSCPEKAKLIHQARLTNDGKPQHVIEQIKRASSQFKNPVIACLGLTFKANIDDCRESPALDIVHRLIGDNSGQLIVVEPNVSAEKIDQLLPEGAEQMSAGQALEAANIVVLLVEHKEFLNLDRSRLMEKVVIDTRGII